MAISDLPIGLVRHNPRCPVLIGLDGFNMMFKMQTSFAVWFPVSKLKCTLIVHVGSQPLTTDSRSNSTPEGFAPLTKSSRSNSPTNCTLWQQYIWFQACLKRCRGGPWGKLIHPLGKPLAPAICLSWESAVFIFNSCRRSGPKKKGWCHRFWMRLNPIVMV